MIRPLANRIVVKPITGEGVTPGGLWVPLPRTTFTADGKPQQQITVGRVLAVGPGKDGKRCRRAPDVKIGEVVTFSDTCGYLAEIDGEQYRIIREDDVVGYTDPEVKVEVLYTFNDEDSVNVSNL